MTPFVLAWLVGRSAVAAPPAPVAHSPALNHYPDIARPLDRQEPGSGSRLQRIQGLPPRFEANQGQTDPSVKFIHAARGYTLFLTATEAVLQMTDPDRAQKASDLTPGGHRLVLSPSSLTPGKSKRSVVRMRVEGANPSCQVRGSDELPGRSNYFIGKNPSDWHTNVPAFARVRYENVYPGIDLVYYEKGSNLEYDFTVKSGADPHSIRIGLSGYQNVRLQGRDVVLETGGKRITIQHPFIYQEIDGARVEVSGRFVLQRKGTLGVRVGHYDVSRPLIVDPVVSYSSYLGGSDADTSNAIAVDSSGNAYVTGWTRSIDFPTANALQSSNAGGISDQGGDAFVAKLNADGTDLLYATYLGGSGVESSWSIAVDSSNNAYIAGFTTSTDFPVRNAIQSQLAGPVDAFVVKLNATGSGLVYSTYLGGSDSDAAKGIALDAAGNAYVTGYTQSLDFPTVNPLQGQFHGFQDSFIVKLNPAGSALVYATYFGGSLSDDAYAIAVDNSGAAYVTGWTDSPDFPLVNAIISDRGPATKAFVLKINSAGSAFVYSTFLGGSSPVDNADEGHAIAVDSAGSAYVAGSTFSPDFPVVNAYQPVAAPAGQYQDGWIAKFDPSGSKLIYSTFFGGSLATSINGLAIDPSGSVYVTGATESTDFPLINPLQDSLAGAYDIFVAKLDPMGSAVYSTYLGGSDTDSGIGIALDSAGAVYVAGGTSSLNFPLASPVDATIGLPPVPCQCAAEGFVAKLTLPPPLIVPEVTAGSVVNAASFAVGSPVAPGSIISIFGSNLAISAVEVSGGSLPTALLTTSVIINGVAAPLFYVSPTQVNAQVPFETQPGIATLVVRVGATSTPAITLPINATAPGIFVYGANRAVAQNADYTLNTPDNPAKPGDLIILYMTGQGAVSNPIPSGAQAPTIPLSGTLAPTTAVIGSANATVLGSVLCPGFVGLLQVNIVVPEIAAGDQTVVVAIGGSASNSAVISIASAH